MVKKTIAAIFSVLVLSSVLTACNTTRGVGEDISDGGNAISGAATKAQKLILHGTGLRSPYRQVGIPVVIKNGEYLVSICSFMRMFRL